MRKIKWAAGVVAMLVAAGFVRADVKVASVFGEHMVLQRDMKVPVWGTADAGEEVSVAFAGQKQVTKADGAGKWRVELAPLSVSDKSAELTVAGKNTLKLADVLVGDVWVCSGQSNMTFMARNADHGDDEIKAANYPNLRLFNVERKTSDKPLDAVNAKWAACTPQSIPDFTAVGYFFGRDLQKDLNIPIGLIHTSWGGTPAEAWTDAATLKGDPDFAAIVKRGDDYAADYPTLMEKYEKAAKAFKEKSAADKTGKAADKAEAAPKGKAAKAGAKAAGAGKAPKKPEAPGANPKNPSVLYNAMIAPLQPYAIKGAIWYQGEANSGRAYQYRKLLPAMITDWRKTWGEGDFPFLVVQLANFGPVTPPGNCAWAELREAQALTAKNLPNCGMSITIDIGNPANIHPTNKQEVGRRLSLVAEKKVYAKDVVDSGPTFKSMTIDGSAAKITFDNLAGELEAKGGKVEGFIIAGDDKKFVPAEARLEGDSVIVSAPGVSKPAAVRYGWANSPTCTLYNKAGLPAGPFRTDDWPGMTAGAK